MIENPFIITERIVPKYFCDRVEETASLIKLIKNGNNAVLISQRRIGKTSLIQYCYEQPEIRDNYLTVYVDILSTGNLKEFTYLLGREVFEVVKSKGQKRWLSFISFMKSIAGKITMDPISGLPSFNLQLGDIVQPEHTLKEIFQFLANAGKPCVVAIDEFQQITKYPESNIEALIRSHLLQINNCRMIFSGSENSVLSQMFASSSRPFYLSASIIELTPIEKQTYVEFIIRMFEIKRKMIQRKIAERIYDLFEGVTFYIQRVCNGLFANTPVGESALEQTLEYTLDEILSSYDLVFRTGLSRLSLRQKELLLAIASEGKVEKITSVDFINRYSLRSSSAVQTASKALIKDNIVVKTDRFYRIGDQFLYLWLKKNYLN